jgi:hypothetical protein
MVTTEGVDSLPCEFASHGRDENAVEKDCLGPETATH